MTNKERLLTLLGFSPPPNAAEGGLLDVGIAPDSTYDPLAINTLKQVAIGMMKVLLTTADTSNNQTGFAIKYDRDAIMKLIDLYEEEIAPPVVVAEPTIKGIQPW
jgi:hypothetical protein